MHSKVFVLQLEWIMHLQHCLRPFSTPTEKPDGHNVIGRYVIMEAKDHEINKHANWKWTLDIRQEAAAEHQGASVNDFSLSEIR